MSEHPNRWQGHARIQGRPVRFTVLHDRPLSAETKQALEALVKAAGATLEKDRPTYP